MGWTGLNKPKKKSIKDFFAGEFNNETDKGKITVIDCSATLTEAYLAMEMMRDGKRTVFGMVCLIRHTRNSYWNFNYKDMDETMEPYAYNCPERILDILTPTDNDNANTWRSKCRLVIKQKKDRPKFKAGDKLEFEEPIRFANGDKLTRLTCVSKKPLRFQGEARSVTYQLNKRAFDQNIFKILERIPDVWKVEINE